MNTNYSQEQLLDAVHSNIVTFRDFIASMEASADDTGDRVSLMKYFTN